jgi:hypothetical protein
MVTGRLARGGSATCKINRWWLQGAEDNSDWLTRSYNFDQQILIQTPQNPGNIPIGAATGSVEVS